ncbi:hypothetical protein CEQ90_17515 [Lewinellaceae bacterium SD302]|nr:hypothetical protein CEQ90_17515 [Lewinellaceae bacterium SD302]
MEIYATLKNIVGDIGYLKVVAFRKSSTDTWKTAVEEVNQTFDGDVVSCNNFSEKRQNHAQSPKAIFHYDNVIIVRSGPTKYAVFQTSKYKQATRLYTSVDQLYLGGQISLETAQLVIDVNGVPLSTSFYIEEGKYTFGPFFCNKDGDCSTKGLGIIYYWDSRTALSFSMDSKEQYLLSIPPGSKGGKLYALSTQDALDWFNRKASASVKLSNEQFKGIQKIVSNVNSQKDIALANKLEQCVKQLDILPQTFARLLTSSPQAQEWAHKNLAEIAHLASTEIAELYEHETELQNELKTLEERAEKLRAEYKEKESIFALKRMELDEKTNHLKKEIEKQEEYLAQLNEETEELQEYNAILQEEFNHERENNFQDFAKETIAIGHHLPFTNKDDLYLEQVEEYGETTLGIEFSFEIAKDLLAAVRSSFCIMSSDVRIGLVLAQAAAAAEHYVATAGYDWLSFSNFKDSILGRVVREAKAKPRKLVVLTLQSFNNSSPAYLLPLLNHLRGVVSHIPGTTVSWPKNLRLMLIPTPSEGECATGLPIQLSLFEGVAAGAELPDQVASVEYTYEPEYQFSASFFNCRMLEPQGYHILEKYCHG